MPSVLERFRELTRGHTDQPAIPAEPAAILVLAEVILDTRESWPVLSVPESDLHQLVEDIGRAGEPFAPPPAA